MDMKKILQAFDGAATKKPAEGVNDMKHFLSVVVEGAKVDRMVAHIKASEKEAGKSDKEAEEIAWATANKRGYLDNKNKKSEDVSEDGIGSSANEFLLAADKINDEVMGQVDKIKINADEALLRDMLDKFNAFMTAYHAVGKEILEPELLDDVEKNPHTSALGKALYRDLSKFKKASPAQQQRNKERWAKNPHNPANKGLGEGLSIADYFNLAEAKKDPCWKGYQQVGMKEKGGKQVPNCVPKKSK